AKLQFEPRGELSELHAVTETLTKQNIGTRRNRKLPSVQAPKRLERRGRILRAYLLEAIVMPETARAPQARTAVQMAPQGFDPRAHRAGPLGVGRTEDAHGWPSERRRHVHRAGVVADEGVGQRQQRDQLADTGFAGGD